MLNVDFMSNIAPFMVFKNITTYLSHVTTSLPWGHVLKTNNPDVVQMCKKLFSFPFACFILCWMLFLATILWRMVKHVFKTTQTFGSKTKHWCLMQWRTTVTVHGCWSWNISTRVMFDRGMFWNLRLQKQNLVIVDFIYALCKAVSPLYKLVTEVMFWFIVYTNESIESTHHECVTYLGLRHSPSPSVLTGVVLVHDYHSEAIVNSFEI